MKKTIKRIIEKFGYTLRRNVPETQWELDAEFNQLYSRAQAVTDMDSSDNPLRRQRHHTLYNLVKLCDTSWADVCEAGCGKGLSAYQIATLIESDNVKFHIFDSFEGLSEFKQADVYKAKPRNASDVREQFSYPLDVAKANLKGFPFIKFYKGWIPERYAEVTNQKFSFVHIDVNLLQPTLDSMEFFYPRMISGGIMAFDDYGCIQFPGAKKAIDLYLRGKRVFFLPLPSGQAFLIKG